MNRSQLDHLIRRICCKLHDSSPKTRKILITELSGLMQAPIASQGVIPQDLTAELSPVNPGSYVRVPFLSKSEQAVPLQSAIGYAASKMSLSHYRVAILITYFLDEIARQVGLGRILRIPGFGIFGPWCWTEKKTQRKVAYPRFVASRAFRRQVSMCCDHRRTKNKELAAYQRSHHPSSKPASHALVSKALKAWRTTLLRQIPAGLIDDGEGQ
jgi:hypothetical protein